MYGIILAIGVLVGVYCRSSGGGGAATPRDGIYDIAFWVVIWGVIGARLYHVVTDYQLFEDDPLPRVPDLEGRPRDLGRGARRRDRRHRDHVPPQAARRWSSWTAWRPGIVLAQAIGRWGNYFNQELFGKPTTLPWALEIAPAHRPAGLRAVHDVPTDVPVRVARVPRDLRHPAARRATRTLKLGQTFALYVALYTFARFFFENMRIDPAHEIAGLRINAWVSIVVFVFGDRMVRVARDVTNPSSAIPAMRHLPWQHARRDGGVS